MDTLGRHLLAEYYGCDSEVLNDLHRLDRLMHEAARKANVSIVASVFHPFTPQGVSGVVVIEESHLSIHTWPEKGYAAVDFYTCGEGMPRNAHQMLLEGLSAKRCEIMELQRGLEYSEKSIKVLEHVAEELSSSDKSTNASQVDSSAETERTVLAKLGEAASPNTVIRDASGNRQS